MSPHLMGLHKKVLFQAICINYLNVKDIQIRAKNEIIKSTLLCICTFLTTLLVVFALYTLCVHLKTNNGEHQKYIVF